MSDAVQIAARMRLWYEDGNKGLLKICAREDVPQAVVDATNRWFEHGRTVLEGFAVEVEQLDTD